MDLVLGGCYPPKPKAEGDNTLLDLHNSSYHTQPHPIIAKYSTISQIIGFMYSMSFILVCDGITVKTRHKEVDTYPQN